MQEFDAWTKISRAFVSQHRQELSALSCPECGGRLKSTFTRGRQLALWIECTGCGAAQELQGLASPPPWAADCDFDEFITVGDPSRPP